MSDNNVSAGIDGGSGDLLFVHAYGRGGVAETFMQRHNRDVDLASQCFYVGNHVIKRSGIGEGVDVGWSARGCMAEFVVGKHVNIGAAGAVPARPRFSRTHTVVTEEAEANATSFDQRGPPGFGPIHAAPVVAMPSRCSSATVSSTP